LHLVVEVDEQPLQQGWGNLPFIHAAAWGYHVLGLDGDNPIRIQLKPVSPDPSVAFSKIYLAVSGNLTLEDPPGLRSSVLPG
jgi:hypothetical protein